MKLGSWPQCTCGQSIMVSQTLKYSSDCHLSQQMSANTSHLSSWTQRVTEKISRLSPELLKGQKTQVCVCKTYSILYSQTTGSDKRKNPKYQVTPVVTDGGAESYWFHSVYPSTETSTTVTNPDDPSSCLHRIYQEETSWTSSCKHCHKNVSFNFHLSPSDSCLSVLPQLVTVPLCHVNIHQQISESSVLS